MVDWRVSLVNHTLEDEEVGDIVPEYTPWSSKRISRSQEERRAREAHRFENWWAGVCWLVKDTMSSLSSSVAVVSWRGARVTVTSLRSGWL